MLDGMVQTCTEDEFVYHEMIVHVPLFTHPDPVMCWLWAAETAGTIRGDSQTRAGGKSGIGGN